MNMHSSLRAILAGLITVIGLGHITFADGQIAVTNVDLIDVGTGEIRQNRTVLMKGDTIAKTGPATDVSVPVNARTIDAAGKWLMPGLVDAHVHYFQSGGLYTRPDILNLRHIRSYKEERQWIEKHMDDLLSRYIRNGVTTTMDMGGPLRYNFKVRDSISENTIAPDVRATGPLISTYQPRALADGDPPIIKAQSPTHAKKLVRQQLSYEPDFIKIWYIVERGETARTHLPIIKAIIDESHRHDLQVAVHATAHRTAKLAVQHGADILVHSVRDQVLDDDFLNLLKANNITYIPTLQVGTNYNRVFSQTFDFDEHVFRTAEPHTLGSLFDLQHIPDNKRPAFLSRWLPRSNVRTEEDSIKAVNLRKVHNAGINVVTGTDAGNIGTLHGASYFNELARMKEAGLGNLAIFRASTLNAGKIFSHTAPAGQIREGYKAHLLLLEGNPLKDLANVKNIAKVIKGGQLIEPDKVHIDEPEAIVQKQLNAYNAGNLDAFLSFYSDSVKVYEYPNTLTYQGRSTMRKIYRDLFFSAPDLHCELLNRITQGQYVIDKERVTGLPNDEPHHATAIYKVEAGKIRSVWFMD